MDLEAFRRDFIKGGLRRNDLNENPIHQFELWFQQAIEAKISDPNAMTLATVGQDGQPSQRVVLLKSFDEKGFVFFTNYGSQKAKEIFNHPKVALHFPWHMLDRQVRITGKAEKITQTESMQYFLSRPKDSQLAAWASKQSNQIGSRQLLLSQFARMKEKFAKGEIPLPDFWGGFRIRPDSIEFWQGGPDRLHDRFLYTKNTNDWSIERLAP
ncbi:MAG: pyridoxamine 5'-phosphate oxidase [Gammaproteobacteria bacterium]|nr:pyridoxamine 5'-phosphate oxidase [Gammaproteobacteria bacterium]MCY4217693.1 pyridoxamine 5'-phosphate oxidase [Gammaproteobacteria bacterium]MCY4275054.1 pyridoxamine 5'-phosphate oxidase [Gammaproteobacteria bacterium]